MINLMSYRPVFFGISTLLVALSLLSLAVFGLRLSIDFTGGSLLEVSLPEVEDLTLTDAQLAVGDVFELQSVQRVETGQFVVRGQEISNQEKDLVMAQLSEFYEGTQELRFERVGAVISSELILKTLVGVVLVAGLILVYLWRQFADLRFGVCAIIALLHDITIVVGVFSLLGVWLGVEVDMLFVTALLTAMAFSIHDTIVVFDRIKELSQKYAKSSLLAVVNTAILQTLSRSFNNSMTTSVMLAALVLLTTETIRWFALALLIGVAVGTYSSPFVAAPLLIVFEKWRRSRR